MPGEVFKKGKLKFEILAVFVVIIIVGLAYYFLFMASDNAAVNNNYLVNEEEYKEEIELPEPSYESDISVEEALKERRSVREYKDEPLEITHISQLLWAAQGITEEDMGFRTAPSAGALYPLEVYVAAGDTAGLMEGIYRYNPREHSLLLLQGGDFRDDLYGAALHQSPVLEAPAVIVFSSVDDRITPRYGERGIRYADMEAGHAAQNIYLQAASLDLGTVVIGAFDDEGISNILEMDAEERPLYLIPVGKQ